jgi:tetratricopeptide (TPR) repeat protein
MHNFSRIMTLMAVVLGATVPATAETPREFYGSLLRRGVASYEASRYPDAAKQLRIAAFGLVDTIDQYQLAQIYLTLTFEKLGQHDKARDAAHRVISAERVERKYAGLTVPAAVRTAFEAAASRLLNPVDVKMLREGTTPPRQVPEPAASPRASAVTAPTTPVQGTAAAAPPATTQTANQRPASWSPQETAPPPRTAAPAPQTNKSAARTTTVENVPQQSITPVPPPQTSGTQAIPPKPAPKPATTAKPPLPTAPSTSRPSQSAPAKAIGSEADGRGGPLESARPPAPSAAPAPRTLTASAAGTRLAAAERALNSSNLNEARRSYRELLGAPGLDHDTLIRIAEGLYRARDFAGSLNAFNRLGTLRRGEEPYQYYIAVAAYETGDSSRAKKALAAALPYIEITPDVARYRGRIESSQ